jgi:predicted nucleotidyltransferase
MNLNGIEFSREQIESFCRERGIQRLSFFGSILRSDFGPASDIDVLVEFQPGVRVGLSFARMQKELSAILGRKVDLNTPGFLSAYFREEIIKEAVVQYDAA